MVLSRTRAGNRLRQGLCGVLQPQEPTQDPCISKHGKRVTVGDWNKEGNLISGSDDKILTVSNSTGDTIHDSFLVRGEIMNVKWCPYKDVSKPLRVVAAIVSGKQMLYLRPED